MKRAFKAIGKYLGVVLIFTVILTAIGFMVSGYIYKEAVAYKQKVLSEYNIAEFEYQPALTTQIYSKKGKLLAEIYDENRRYLPYSEIPDNVKNALVSVEDRRFYQHHGVDPMGVLRALATNFTSGNATRQGASSLTQQVSRQIFLSTEKTWERKLKELVIALELEKKFDKNKILEMYLNEVYFGHQAYGIESASRVYFGKSAKDLTIDEAALLVGLPQAPHSYDPLRENGPEKAIKRRLAVLDSMVRDKYITKEQAAEMAKMPLNLKKSDSNSKKVTNLVYPHYTSWVIKQLEKQYGQKVYSSGWKIYTTIDDTAQQAAEDTAQEYARKFSDWYDMNDIAIVTINPQTGELVAMAGGADFGKSQINMAASPRQPGSTMKPLVYAAGIDKGIISDSTIELDEAVDINGWKPNNYDFSHKGWITIREALRISNNIVAVKTAQKIKVQNIRHYLELMGVTTLTDNDVNLGMALGGLSKGISPYQMASAYGVFANRGEFVQPHVVYKVVDQRGNIVEQFKPAKKKVLQTETADLIADMMQDVVTQGTGRAAQIGRPMAGKTGTTNDNRDLWFVGYTPNASTAVWLGNSDYSKPKGRPGSGSTAGTVWRDYMSQYIKNLPYASFKKDFALSSYSIYLENGAEPRLAGKYCAEQPNGTVKTFLLQPKFAPTETVECKPVDPTVYIKDSLANGKTIQELVDEGMMDKLVKAGYISQLVDAGYFDKLAEGGFIQELKKAGYEKQLIDKGYIEQVIEEPVEQPETEPAPSGDSTPVKPTQPAPSKPTTPTPTTPPSNGTGTGTQTPPPSGGTTTPPEDPAVGETVGGN